MCMVRSPAIPEIARLIVRTHNRVTPTTRNNSRARPANFLAKDEVWHFANGRYIQGRLTFGAQRGPKIHSTPIQWRSGNDIGRLFPSVERLLTSFPSVRVDRCGAIFLCQSGQPAPCCFVSV